MENQELFVLKQELKTEPDPEPVTMDPNCTLGGNETVVTTKPSIHRMRRAELIQEIKQERDKNKALVQRKNDLKEKILQFSRALANRKDAERDSLLQQLQEEISKNEALRQQLTELELSKQLIVDTVGQQNAIREQNLLQQIDDLTRHCHAFHVEMHELRGELNEINEENSCSICLSPWEAQGAHRLVSLRCGHLFGDSCLQQHLARNAECPYCKQAVQRTDLRYIFGHRVLPGQPAQPSDAAPEAPAAQPVQRQEAHLEQQAPAVQPVPALRRLMIPPENRAPRQQAALPVQPAPVGNSRRQAVQPLQQAPRQQVAPAAQPAARQQLQPAPRVQAPPALQAPRQQVAPAAQPAARQRLQPAPPLQAPSAQQAPRQQVALPARNNLGLPGGHHAQHFHPENHHAHPGHPGNHHQPHCPLHQVVLQYYEDADQMMQVLNDWMGNA